MTQVVINVGTSPNDGSGDPLRTAFQSIQGNFTELYALQSQTINAGAVIYTGTIEARINAAIFDAVTQAKARVFVPDVMTPYNASLVTFSANVQMIREGGSYDVYDVMAYGAYGDNSTDDSAAIQAAVLGAQAAGTGTGGRVYFPHPPVRYFIGSTTITASAHGIIFEAADRATYITYSGTGYAVSFGIAGAAQMSRCGFTYLGILCTNSAGNGFYIKSPYGFTMREAYFENTNSVTGVAITIDSGSTALGTGYSANQVLIISTRTNGFLKGILFKGGSLAGNDIAVGCDVQYSFMNSQVGLAGSVGIEFQGSQQCSVLGGNMEVLDTGILLTGAPSACQGISQINVRYEAIAVNNWVIPSGSTNCSIISPRWLVDNGSDLALDTLLFQNGGYSHISSTHFLIDAPLDYVRANKRSVTCANGANTSIDIANSGYVQISGPTAGFSISGFTGYTDGREVEVVYLGSQILTVKAGDTVPGGTMNIRTLSADGGADVVCGTPYGATLLFRYNAGQGQWILTGKR